MVDSSTFDGPQKSRRRPHFGRAGHILVCFAASPYFALTVLAAGMAGADEPDAVLKSILAGSRHTASLASGGDFNGDGYSDLLVGAPDWSGDHAGEGAVFVVLGGVAGIDPSGEADAVLRGGRAGAALGTSVATAGDVDGDGFDDILIGAPGYQNVDSEEGAAFVYYGGASGIASGVVSSADASLFGNQVSARFGSSVDGAGDVNGDGFADIAVGAPGYDKGSTVEEGGAFVFLGSASGVVGTGPDDSATRIESEQSHAELGYSVSGAGDVDGDGFDDLIVGAPRYDADETDEGIVLLYLGGAGGIASGGPAAAARQIEGDQAFVHFGQSVDAAGDIDGDGFADIVVGAPRFYASTTSEGAAFVFHGRPSGIGGTSASEANTTLAGLQDLAGMGISVAGVGDVNGDGYSDVLVGATGFDQEEFDEGAAFLYLGRANGIPDGGTDTADGVIELDHPGAALGSAVAAAGDVDSDGFADYVVGAPEFDGQGADEGIGLLLRGKPLGITTTDPGTAHAQIAFGGGFDDFGLAVASAGDVNGDGYGDLVVGAPMHAGAGGAIFVFHGGPSGLAHANPNAADAEISAGSGVALFGARVASAGDVNGDGYGDLIVGAPATTTTGEFGGAVFVFLGSASGITATDSDDAHRRYDSGQTNDLLGLAVSSAGDVNGDGFGDVVFGSQFLDAGEGLAEGAVFFFLGSAGGLIGTDLSQAHARIESNVAGARLGGDVASVGDTNGDGYGDVIVGSPGWALGRGAAFVYQGGQTGITATDPLGANTLLQADIVGTNFGLFASGAGDVNGDGYDDVIVGAPTEVTRFAQGAAFVFLGSDVGVPNGTPLSADTRLESDQIGRFGTSVAAAGDVNGDGYSDVVVGAPDYDLGEVDEGAAFVFLGGDSGIPHGGPASAAGRIESNQGGARLGLTAASAGDVDGDGFAEVVVGADGFDSGGAEAGAVFVHLGGGWSGLRFVLRPRQAASSQPIEPWGVAEGDSFAVEMRGYHPSGRGRVKLEVESCPSGVAFGDLACSRHVGSDWVDTTLPTLGPTLRETITGLSSGQLYRFRARLLFAPLHVGAIGTSSPAQPRHGPWRHPTARRSTAGPRAVPEPTLALGAIGGGLASLWLLRWRLSSRGGRRARRAG